MSVKWKGMQMAVTRHPLEIERLLGEGWIVCRHTRTWQPPMDVYESDDGVVVQIEVAGMRKEDFSISLTGRTLVVTGRRVDAVPQRMYYQMEIRFGDFRAEVYLPWSVEPEVVEADYEDGFLKVILPKAKAQKVRIIR